MIQKKQATRDLLEVTSILESARIKFWLETGTLLGAVREGDFINWDVDIDLGMMFNDRDKLISVIPKLWDKRFQVVRLTDFAVSIRKDAKDSTEIDIVLMRLRGDRAWSAWTRYGSYRLQISACSTPITSWFTFFMSRFPKIPKQARYPLWKFLRVVEEAIKIIGLQKMTSKIFWKLWLCSGGRFIPQTVSKDHYVNLDSFKFCGFEFNIPSEPEEYLRHRYGEDWIVHKSNWNFWEDDRSIDRTWEVKTGELA